MSDSQEHFGFGAFVAGVIVFGGIGFWFGGLIGFIIGLVITILAIIGNNAEAKDMNSFVLEARRLANSVFNWTAHLFFLFLGIAVIFYGIVNFPHLSHILGFTLGGLFFIAASLFFLPPIRRKAFAITKRPISTKARAFLAFSFSVVGLVAITSHAPEILEHRKEVAAQQADISFQRAQEAWKAAEEARRVAAQERMAAEQAAEQERRAAEQARRAEERERRIQSQFSMWNGAHRNLESKIKASMNDPRSYRHVRTEWADQGEYVLVRTTFRGKNAFGGTITTTVEARVDLDGNVIWMDGF